ncbi:MAG: potassium channel family protein [Acidimicrobiia bacterium]|jgi:voltage-gated potassium channel|nr:MAG: potassium channel family protein [Acidimicrobiia bacterium]
MRAQAQRLHDFLELPIIIAALLVIPVVVVQERDAYARANGLAAPYSDAVLQWALIADWAIWAVFLLELVLMLVVVRQRWRYLRENWVDVAVVVFSLPLLAEGIGAIRLIRLARLGRLARLLKLLKMPRLAAVLERFTAVMRRIFARRGLAAMLVATLAMVVTFAALVYALDDGNPAFSSFGEVVWWAFVTVTTVGYGDIVPQAPVARGVAVVLMLVGIGFVATVTASIASFFVEDDGEGELAELRAQMNRLEEKLDRLLEED